ncbi:cell division protein FtsB [Arsenophonus symbiont of Ornithomya chloropus]|uniref:cell division protein FtsB n=1 Tax=Arsenophonus symbiont of Ornithomya chloropus TaxID=634121 RepID=UPI0032B2C83A
MRVFMIILLIVLFCLQYSLWLGKNGVYDYMRLKNEILSLERLNMILKSRNKYLFSEVDDLKAEGLEVIEERARSELMMIKPGESFYRIIKNNTFISEKKK